MVRRIIYGEPFDTMAVVAQVAASSEPDGLNVEKHEDRLCFSRELGEKDAVYGLGETVGGINKRGRRFISYNVDNFNHTQNTLSLYASHNFLIVDGSEHLGFFFDTPARVIFDIDVDGSGQLRIFCDGGSLNLYCIDGASAYDVAKQFLGIIGRSVMPPLWAFGFMQSRWGYRNERDIRSVVDGYRKSGIPLDAVCLDIDYMDRYIDFTINKHRFPDMPGFIREMGRKGIHLVPIVDAGIKIEPGNAVYEEGVEKGYFCKGKNGENFEAAVWPGMTHFTDFMQPEARSWFGDQYKFYTELGFDGFWNDMNEPSIFYSEYSKGNRVFDKLEGEDDNYQKGVKICDYKNFYHNVNGKQVVHHDLHNVYGYFMTMSAGEALNRLLDRRYLLFSRSSYIGAHRYGGIWTGDNTSKWSHLSMIVKQMPSLNMCGFLYSGSDIGGFGGNTTRELLLRWLAFGVFTPLMRNHAAIGTRRQECYRFTGRKAFRGIISLRYRLLPYIYSEFMKAALRQDMYMKPLSFEYPGDETARGIEDQLLVGESIMVAPFLEKGKNERRVYLPEEMIKVFYDGSGFRFEKLPAGWHTVRASVSEVVFFIRKGKLLPIGRGASCTDKLDMRDITLYGDGESYELYRDDGTTKHVTPDNIIVLRK